jgi:hypothetical protein
VADLAVACWVLLKLSVRVREAVQARQAGPLRDVAGLALRVWAIAALGGASRHRGRALER